MKIHEYQARKILSDYGIPVPEGRVADAADEAKKIASEFGVACVVKAQVHCGGRGKAGGVKLAHDAEEAYKYASEILGMKLVNNQTGPEGKIVHKVLVSKSVDVRKEMYLSLAFDNDSACLVILASKEGGTEIEEVAKNKPEAIVRIPVSLDTGVRGYHVLAASQALGLSSLQAKQLDAILKHMGALYVEKDCSLVEVNPLVEDEKGNLVCLDAKVNFDDNALFRHPDIVALRDVAQEDPREYKASLFDLNYVSLDGNIGCLVNGAGLAMATMDIIKNYGGNPANFLDVGGSATVEKVKAGFEILLSDEKIKVIFVNIFGGIMKCDVIAQGLVIAAKEIGLPIPLVVRLEGTNVDIGRKIIQDSGLKIIAASDMADGARKAIREAKA
jgi:succinyl-CoA synthetase beta subunit